MFLTLKDKVWWFALYSRVFVLVTSAFSNFVIPDHSADAFIAPKSHINIEETFIDVVIKFLFEGLLRWDAQYFIHISKYGYTYENCLAFFPLFPLLSRTFSQFIYLALHGFLNEDSVFLITALSINLYCFVKSASLLYDLSLRVVKNENLAYKAAILFCVNPASIFFSAPYSESLFSYLSFYGMLKCYCSWKNNFSVDYGILFGLSAVTRSNGILNLGFILYNFLKNVVTNTECKLKNVTKLETIMKIPSILLFICSICGSFVVSSLFAILPFLGFQMYGYFQYCTLHNHTLPEFLVIFAHSNNLILPGRMNQPASEDHWCKYILPLSYSYIQSHYWNVGFLRYYSWKQIPNFLLASPVIILIFRGSYKYFEENRQYCMRLGLSSSSLANKRYYNVHHNGSSTLLPEEVFPYILHAVFLTVFSVFCAHVQVTTRLVCSSSPVLYWLCAEIWQNGNPLDNKTQSFKLSKDLMRLCKREKEQQEQLLRLDIEPLENMCSHWKVFIITKFPSYFYAKFIQCYFISFFIVGTVLFSNFLPWT